MSFELVLLAPALVLLVLFVLWAGRGGRAGLVADLAAGEAAVVASLCCEDGADPDAQEARETVVEQVLAGRPGLEFLCIGGARPGTGTPGSNDEFVDEAWLESFVNPPEGAPQGVGAIGVRFECETDGAVAPLRSVFPRVSFFGQATEVIAIAPAPVLSLGGTRYEEGDTTDPADNELEFIFELTAPTSQPFDIFYKTNTLSASPPDPTHAKSNDYAEVTAEQSFTVAANATSINSVKVAITRDDLYELDETFHFEWRIEPTDPCASDAPVLINPVSSNAEIQCSDPSDTTTYEQPVIPGTKTLNLDYWKAQPAIGTILNDDGRPTLSVPDASAVEGNPIVFTVGLDAPTGVDVEFTAETKDDTATALADYTSLSPTTYTITADETTAPSMTITVPTIDDTTGEGDETFTLEATVTNGHALPPITLEAVGTIVDNEPKVSIADSTSAIPESNPSRTFVVSIDRAATASAVTVDWATASAAVGNPATGGTGCTGTLADYVSDSGTLTFFANTTILTQTITVTVCDDLREEPQSEWFEVQLSNQSSNTSILDGSGRAQITDNDPQPAVSVAVSPASVDEGNQLDFVVSLDRQSELVTGVDYAVNDGTGTDPAEFAKGDYSINSPHSRSGTLTFAAGDTDITITVQALIDGNYENDETLEVTLTNPVRATFGTPTTAIGTILDNRPNQITISDASGLEGSNLVFTVTVTPVLNQAVTVDYATADNTATAGADYTAVPTTPTTTLTIPANTTSATISIPVLKDTVNEVADETFFVNLSNATPVNLVGFSDPKGEGTIQNVISRDLCINDAATVTEGQALVFEVVLGEYSSGACAEKASTETVTVNWKTRDPNTGDPATGGADYVAVTSATLSFAPGETKKTLSVQTNNDQDYAEPTEKLFVDLITTSAQNGVVRDAVGEGEIDNVPRAKITVADASADEGNDLIFTVSATNLPATGNVTVDYAVAGITATGPGSSTGDDFDMKSPATATGTLTFSSSTTTATVTLTTESGDAYEPDETLRIDLSSPSANAVLSDATGIGTINQECVDPTKSTQDPPVLSFRSGRLSGLSQTLGTAEEGQQIPFAVTINAPFCKGSGGGYFKLRTSNVTATSGSDYTAASNTVGYKIGDVSTPTALNHDRQTVVYISTADDQIDELDETFDLVVNWLDTGTDKMEDHYLLNIADVNTTGTITDNDPLPNVSVSDAAAAEGSDVVFTITMDRASSRAVTLSYATAVTGTGVGHAIEGTDYTRTRGSLTIAAGTTSAQVSVPTATDTGYELRETFRLNLTLTSSTTARLSVGTAEGTILHNRDPIVTINDVTVLENAGTATFTLSLSRAATGTEGVTYRTRQLSSGDFATSGVDYTNTSGTVSFNNGDTSATVSVPIINDTTIENNEQFQVRLTNPQRAVIGDFTGVGTIIDDDTPCIDPTDTSATPPTLTIADKSTTEAANNLAFTPSLSQPFCADAALTVTTSGGTATAGVDYVSWSATVTVPPHHTGLTWGIQVLDDSLVENDETFNLSARWASSMPAVFRARPPVTAVGTITNDDGDLELSVNDPVKVDEGSTVGFVVSLDKVGGRDVTVQYTTSDCSTTGCAEAGKDYTAVSGTATIPAGDISVVVSVQTLTDNEATESDETFNLVLSSPTGATLDDATGVGTIANVGAPQISVNDATAAEGSTLTFVVSLDRISTSVVSVDYATKDVTATAGADYSAVSGTLVFSPSQTVKTVQVATATDGISEASETFQLVLSKPVNASLDDHIGVGTITNVNAPKLRVSDITATEGGTLSFEVALDAAATWDVVVPFTTKDGTAVQPGDYTASASTVTIGAGDTTASVSVVTFDDRLDEDAETMRLVLSATNDAVLADPIAVGTLFDNDAMPSVSLTSATFTGHEAGTDGFDSTLSFTVQLSEASGRAVTVDYATDGLTATAGSDFTDTDGTLTIAAGSTTGQVSVSITNDTESEAAETFRFSLSNPVSATLGSPATAQGIILDDDNPVPSVLLRNHTPATEGNPATVEVTLIPLTLTKVVTVYYSTSDGTGTTGATAGTDYTAATNTKLTFALRERAKTISIPTVDDTDLEGDETFTVSLSNAANANIVDQTTTLTILDNDGDPHVSIADASASEGNTATFTVSLSFAAKQEVTVAYEARVDGSAGSNSAVPGLDFTAAKGTLTFSVGDTAKTVTVSTIEDVFDEADETFWVQLTSATNATVVDSTAEGVIIDDDPLPALSVGDASASEGDAVVFTVRLSAASGRDVTATYATAAHTSGQDPATAGTDYTAAPGTLRIPAGSTSTTFSVATLTDSAAEHDETFLVKIDNPANATIADSTGLGTIIDTDGQPRLSVADISLFEDKGPAQFTVSLSHASPDDDVTVGYRTAACSGDGCAASGSDCTAAVPPDYEFASGTLTITAGDTSGTIDVALCDDLAEEGDETFTLELVSPTNATILVQDATATILDDDGPPRISVADVELDEDDGPAEFTVTLSHAADEDVTVKYATFDRTATQPADYTATAGTLTIPAGDTTATISVAVVNDNLAEGTPTWVYPDFECPPDWAEDTCELVKRTIRPTYENLGTETFLLRLDTPTGATLDDAEAIGEIADDEDLPTLSSTAFGTSVAECDCNVTLWPTLSHPSVHTVSIGYEISMHYHAGQRLYPDNPLYQYKVVDAATGELEIPPGETTTSITFPIYDNDVTTIDNNHFLTFLNAVIKVELTGSALNGRSGNRDQRVYVWDDETYPFITAIDAKDVLESAGNGVFEFTLNRLAEVDATVRYETVASSSTATEGTDYTKTEGTVTIPAGSNVASVSVPIMDDTINEQSETVVLQVIQGHADNRNISYHTVGSGTLTILDNDETPALSVGDTQATEASESLEFLVTLDRVSSKAITVDYATSDGTGNDAATQPGDYTRTSGTLTITAGDKSGTITVPIVNDDITESDERFTITLSNATNATIADDKATGVILDGNSLPILTVNDSSRSEAIIRTSRHLYFTFNLNEASTVSTYFEYRVIGVPSLGEYAATPGIDFNPKTHRNYHSTGDGWYRVTIGANQVGTYSWLPLEIYADIEPEQDERFKVELRNPIGITLGSSEAWGTIVNDDLPIVTISDVTVTESAKSAVLTLNLHDDGINEGSLKYRTKVLTTSGHSASPGDDYTHTEGTLKFPVGTTTATITVPILGDTTDEYDEKFVLEFSSPDELTLNDTIAVVTVTDDDDGWHITDDTEAEGTALSFTVTRDNTTSALTLNYTVQEAASSSATGGTHCTTGIDYITPSGTLSFAAGSATATLTVNTCDDTVTEGAEIFLIKLTSTTPTQTGAFQGRKLTATATISSSD